jgi:hypothetical protein
VGNDDNRMSDEVSFHLSSDDENPVEKLSAALRDVFETPAGPQPPSVPSRPSDGASKGAWVEYAQGLGLDLRGDAKKDWTKDEIRTWCAGDRPKRLLDLEREHLEALARQEAAAREPWPDGYVPRSMSPLDYVLEDGDYHSGGEVGGLLESVLSNPAVLAALDEDTRQKVIELTTPETGEDTDDTDG